jgi:hypothetical protein
MGLVLVLVEAFGWRDGETGLGVGAAGLEGEGKL